MNVHCAYCNQHCYKNVPTSEFWRCDHCKVQFHDAVRYEIFRVDTAENEYYELHVGPRNTYIRHTTIYFSTMAAVLPSYIEKIVLELDTPMQGVTPQNAAEKLKTLLVFS